MSVEQLAPAAPTVVTGAALDARWLRALRAMSPALVAHLLTLYGMRRRVVSFALTGGTGALVQLSLLAFLTHQGWSHLVANGAAFLVSMQVNFWLNLRFTWRDRGVSPGLRSLAARWTRFHGAVAGTAALNMAVFALAATMLPHLVAAALGIGVAAVANFVSGDRFVFRARS